MIELLYKLSNGEICGESEKDKSVFGAVHADEPAADVGVCG